MADVLNLNTPEQIIQMLKDVQLSPSEKKKLHKELANDTKQFFKQQINDQQDIDGKRYAPRKRRKVKIQKTGRARIRKKMLDGVAKKLTAKFDETGFSVGLTGKTGTVAKIHNDGQSVTYTKRINGWFNKKTQKWEGGTKQKAAYKMPKRTLIGWTKPLEQQIANKILQHMEPKK